MADGVRVDIEGLQPFRRALKALGPAYAKELQQLNKSFARRVADDARSRYETQHSRRTGRGSRSIRPLASQARAQVAIGSASAPYVPGQEFGSRRWRRFPPHKEGGHFLYPAIRDQRPEISAGYLEALDKLARSAFPTGGG